MQLINIIVQVLSDFIKRKNYDEQLRKEESGRVLHNSGTSHSQEGGGKGVEMSTRWSLQWASCLEELPKFLGMELNTTLKNLGVSSAPSVEILTHGYALVEVKVGQGGVRWKANPISIALLLFLLMHGCSQYHQAKDGDGWVESGCSSAILTPNKVEIPRAFVCAESKIFDVSEWAICQGMECKANTHGPTFHVNMVGLDRMELRSNPSRYPWGLDAEMIIEDDEFDLWLQQALASGIFTESPKRRKSWPFKINQKGIRAWRKSP
ncbi:hypothetical protein ZIOFF_048886 [Zingiber officinale]|uniref:Cleavage inducing molecular chaperone Jiv domain-containing protein n=1 Tax=Zingiber officinale TaxID=94328 RepID=A0A8J5FRU7_ZINOF|nr:hypothetical protein ZIOFF_048886 [Zingiber officinale]